jgi:hypothetical protein
MSVVDVRTCQCGSWMRTVVVGWVMDSVFRVERPIYMYECVCCATRRAMEGNEG